MRIIFLINSAFPYYAGGIETWLYNVSKKLCNVHEISIVSIDYKPYPILFEDIADRIKFYKFKTMLSYSFLRPFVRSYLYVVNLYIGAYSMGKVLRRIVGRNEEYYIIALDTMFNVKAGVMAKKINPNIKLIASSRGPHAEIYSKSYPLIKGLLFKFESKMLKCADVIWANGYDTAKLLEDKGFKAILMRNGVNFKEIDKYTCDNEFEEEFNTINMKIVSVGTLLPIKGIYELIDAISILSKRNINDIELFFIGKGSPKRYVDYARSIQVDNRVHFLGYKNNVVAYMKKCEIVACLSGGSGMSMAAIEAMASKTPIIAWDSPVYRQFNKNVKTMFLVKENDSKALADGIIEMTNYYDTYKKMAEDAYNESKRYDWSNISQELIANLYRVKRNDNN